jgi:hypothetical protein
MTGQDKAAAAAAPPAANPTAAQLLANRGLGAGAQPTAAGSPVTSKTVKK